MSAYNFDLKLMSKKIMPDKNKKKQSRIKFRVSRSKIKCWVKVKKINQS